MNETTAMNEKPVISEEELAALQQIGVTDEIILKRIAHSRGALLPSKSTTETWLDKFITCHPSMLKMKETVKKLAPLEDCVLIMGKTGTGKELIANALHHNRVGKFVAINCASMPENLLEDELFGHEKGAFTGAIGAKEGLLMFAKKGTVFLDEVGDMPLLLQSKLLRAIQEKTIRKVGGHRDEPIDARFVGATHRDMSELIKEGRFREDLYYRMSTFEIETLPLSIRSEDISLIVKSLCSNFPEEIIKKISSKHLEGNVRSLQRIVRRYLVLGEIPQ